MFDYQTIKIMHRHGDDDWAAMTEGGDHGSAAHDPERAWLRRARILRCSRCDDAIALLPEGDDRPEAEIR